MVAFSCCLYDGGEEERLEMDSVREKGWKGKFRRRSSVINPGLNRISGKCPLTPVEVVSLSLSSYLDFPVIRILRQYENRSQKEQIFPWIFLDLQMFTYSICPLGEQNFFWGLCIPKLSFPSLFPPMFFSRQHRLE